MFQPEHMPQLMNHHPRSQKGSVFLGRVLITVPRERKNAGTILQGGETEHIILAFPVVNISHQNPFQTSKIPLVASRLIWFLV